MGRHSGNQPKTESPHEIKDGEDSMPEDNIQPQCVDSPHSNDKPICGGELGHHGNPSGDGEPSNNGEPSRDDEPNREETEEERGKPDPIAAANAERDRMREQLLRIAADFDNFRKRSRKEIEEVCRRSIEDTLREVLPIVDNLERAVNATSAATEVSTVIEGIHMVLRSFADIAHRLGLKRVPSVGAQFDPACHDAMQQEATDEHPPGTIVSEVVPGYFLGDRLLRPAMVTVAKRPAPVTPDTDPPIDDDRDSDN